VKKPKINVDALPEEPVFDSSNVENVKQNKGVVAQVKQLASTGDIDAIKAMPKSPSTKVEGYKKDVIQSVHDQLHPPPPPKPLSACGTDMVANANVVTGKAFKDAPKLGKYAILGEVTPAEGAAGPAIPIGSYKNKNGRTSDWNAGKASWNKLNSEERYYTKSYTGVLYDDINDALRSGSNSHGALTCARGVMKSSITLKKGTLLSRYHNLDALSKSQLKVGQVLQDRGCLSTSTNPGIWRKPSKVHLRIRVGDNCRGLPARKFSVHPSEREVILPSNTRMVVRHIHKHGNHTVVSVDMLPTVDSQCCPP